MPLAKIRNHIKLVAPVATMIIVAVCLVGAFTDADARLADKVFVMLLSIILFIFSVNMFTEYIDGRKVSQ